MNEITINLTIAVIGYIFGVCLYHIIEHYRNKKNK